MRLLMILLVLFLILFYPANAVEIKFIEKICLNQDKEVIQVCVSFVATKNNTFFLADVKGSNIKIYNSKGTLVNIWGKKGAGPNEFLAPITCDYYNNELAVADVVKREIIVFNIKDKSNLHPIKRYKCSSVGMAMSLMDDGVLIGASKHDSQGNAYDLFVLHFNNKYSYLLPSGIKYGMQPFQDVREIFRKRPDINAIGSDGKCAWANGNAYYFWQGNLKVFKIDKNTGKRTSFGKKTSNYVEPFASKKMIEAYRNLDIKKYNNEKNKMSIINSIFANNKYIGLLYKSPDIKDDKSEPISKFLLQFYTLAGNFINEMQISNEYSEMYMKQWGEYIYFLTTRVDDDLNEIFEISKYFIIDTK